MQRCCSVPFWTSDPVRPVPTLITGRYCVLTKNSGELGVRVRISPSVRTKVPKNDICRDRRPIKRHRPAFLILLKGNPFASPTAPAISPANLSSRQQPHPQYGAKRLFGERYKGPQCEFFHTPLDSCIGSTTPTHCQSYSGLRSKLQIPKKKNVGIGIG